MGTSTNATVAFGFDLGEELPEAWRTEDDSDGSFDWDDIVAAESGVVAPVGEYDSSDPAWPKYWDATRKAVAKFPFTLIHHCSGDCPMYFLAVNGTEQVARRGYPEKLKRVEFAQHETIAAMRAFCDKHGIEWQEPAWHLFSYWG
jgi:hypothetical protein